ncbi:hypothetical protein BC831DRAFT_57764 [Entophlyctis helioformis]|nr:hypothetical protein BC831DRAFT_57764 [Entophlyctis helioformis]
MFTNFDGDYKSRRNINLGGSNKARQDKEALLRQAQQERLMREQERRRMASASRIQAFYRGRRVSRHASQEQRQAFDHRVMPLLHTFADPSLAASERQSSPLQDPASLMDATARLLLFWSVSKDTDRLAALAVCLAQPSADADIPFVLLPFVRCADQGLRWKRLLVRLANCMLQTLSLAENTPKNDGADTASLAALYNLFDDFLLNTTNGPVLNRKTPLDSLLIYAPKRTCPVPADAPFDCVHLDDARFLIVQQGLFETVRAMITAATGTSATGPSATGDSRSSKAVHLAIAAMRSFTRTSMLFDGILVQFALQVLTVPSLLKARLRPADAAILRLGVPLDRLARLLAEIAQDDSSHPLSSWNLGLLDADTSQRSMLSLLANFMGLWETRVASSSASSAELSLYLTAMQSLLSAINPATFARVNAQCKYFFAALLCLLWP